MNLLFMAYLMVSIIILRYVFIYVSPKQYRLKRYLGLVLLSSGLWNLSMALSTIFSDPTLKIIFHELKYLGVLSLPIHTFIFSKELTNIGFKINRKRLIQLYAFPVFVLAMIVTNPIHHFFRQAIWIQTMGQFSVVLTRNNWLFYWMTAYSYLLYIGAIIIMLVAVYNASSIYRKRLLLAILGILSPFVLNGFYNGLGLNSFSIDPTPFALVISIVAMHHAESGHKAFRVSPVARNLVFKQIFQPVIVLDENNLICDLNDSAEKLFKTNLNDIIGEDISTLDDRLSHSLINGPMRFGDAYYNVTEAPLYQDKDYVFGKVLILYDMTLQQKYTMELEFMSFHDALTKTYNKHYLKKYLEKEMQNDNMPLGLIVGDLNKLKSVNDIYGHDAGDEVLTKMVDKIRSLLDESNKVIRLGGDEFLILVPHMTDSEAFNKTALQISRLQVSKNDIVATIAVGTALMTSTSDSFEEKLRHADKAMYKQKMLRKRND